MNPAIRYDPDLIRWFTQRRLIILGGPFCFPVGMAGFCKSTDLFRAWQIVGAILSLTAGLMVLHAFLLMSLTLSIN